MKTTHTVGTIALHAPNKLRRFPVKITVELTEGEEPRLSITGSFGDVAGYYGGGGQCHDVFDDETFELAAGWSAEAVARLREVWDRWHLNDMRAGCEHQRAEGWNRQPIDPSRPLDADEHPEGLLMRPCETCGYRYGSAWLYEPMPDDVLEYVRGLAGAREAARS